MFDAPPCGGEFHYTYSLDFFLKVDYSFGFFPSLPPAGSFFARPKKEPKKGRPSSAGGADFPQIALVVVMTCNGLQS